MVKNLQVTNVLTTQTPYHTNTQKDSTHCVIVRKIFQFPWKSDRCGEYSSAGNAACAYGMYMLNPTIVLPSAVMELLEVSEIISNCSFPSIEQQLRNHWCPASCNRISLSEGHRALQHLLVRRSKQCCILSMTNHIKNDELGHRSNMAGCLERNLKFIVYSRGIRNRP